MIRQVQGIYPWPYDGPWAARSTARVVVDMQRDFLDPCGWFAQTGGDIGPLGAIVPAVAAVVAKARRTGIMVLFTVEAHRPDLADLPANKQWRAERLGAAIGAPGPLGRHLVAGEAGTSIVAALAPQPGEPVLVKPGKTAFIGSDFEHVLRRAGVRNLIFAGITTDGAVQCTLRDANDRGFECLVLDDATASDVPADHVDQIHTLTLAGGHYGSIANATDLAAALAEDSLP